LRRLIGRTHVPALSLGCAICPGGAAVLGAARQLSAGVVVAGAATTAPDVRSVAKSPSGAKALWIAADMT
jgi:hypothetical protein